MTDGSAFVGHRFCLDTVGMGPNDVPLEASLSFLSFVFLGWGPDDTVSGKSHIDRGDSEAPQPV